MNCIVIDLVHSKVSDDMAAVTDGKAVRESSDERGRSCERGSAERQPPRTTVETALIAACSAGKIQLVEISLTTLIAGSNSAISWSPALTAAVSAAIAASVSPPLLNHS